MHLILRRYLCNSFPRRGPCRETWREPKVGTCPNLDCPNHWNSTCGSNDGIFVFLTFSNWIYLTALAAASITQLVPSLVRAFSKWLQLGKTFVRSTTLPLSFWTPTRILSSASSTCRNWTNRISPRLLLVKSDSEMDGKMLSNVSIEVTSLDWKMFSFLLPPFASRWHSLSRSWSISPLRVEKITEETSAWGASLQSEKTAVYIVFFNANRLHKRSVSSRLAAAKVHRVWRRIV